MLKKIIKTSLNALGYNIHRIFKPDQHNSGLEEYITWLMYANPGMLLKGNIQSMRYVLSNLRSGSPIIEIGSFCGLSANVITFYKTINKLTNNFFCVDEWIYEGYRKGYSLGGHPSIKHEDYHDFIKSTFERNVSFFSGQDKPYAVEKNSDAFFELWNSSQVVSDVFGRTIKLGGLVSFAYIDGNHSFEYALRDFENVDKLLEKGGFILFDDSADGSGWGVCDVIKIVVSTGRYEVVQKNPNYLFRKIK